jgi:hypothetical protein
MPPPLSRCIDEAQVSAAGRVHDDATIVVLCRPELESSLAAGPAEMR